MTTPSAATALSADRLSQLLPNEGHWAGRAWVPAALASNDQAGPRVITVTDGLVYDLTPRVHTFAALVNAEDPLALLSPEGLPELGTLEELLTNSLYPQRAVNPTEETKPYLLAPNDLLSIKACGVTFIKSLLERVVEEQAQGDPAQASHLREAILDTLGDDLSQVRPGSPETVALKQRLQAQGVWSQYLEVGIGPDAEVFTKAQPLSAVGFGAEIGVLPTSKWNNPEPEIVLAVSNTGKIVGATLGNDVNLRDYEGRSALLLGKAKDENGSTAIGPLVRFFDDTFTLEQVKSCEVELRIDGPDGFSTQGRNRMAEISRPPEDLVAGTISEHHQYPDGLMLFLGTMFTPAEDRLQPGEGFTHLVGDRVEIATEHLGSLINWVNHTNAIPRWEYGLTALFHHLQQLDA